MRNLNREAKEEEHQEDMFAFNKLLTLESQMESLKTKGFLRAYKDYSPPADLNTRFIKCVSSVLEKELTMDNMDSVEISDSRQKLKLLKSLASEFDHKVHNSRLHMMKTLGDVYLFYKVNSAEVKTSLMKYFSVSDILSHTLRPAPRGQRERPAAGEPGGAEEPREVHWVWRSSSQHCLCLPQEQYCHP